ncbi:restriction endonuclease subunit S [Vibrio vulnificus]
MGNSWKTVCIDDIKSPEKYSCVGGPFGSSLSRKHYVDSGVPVIRGVNLSGDSFSESDFVFVSKEKALELQRNMAFRGDLVFTQRGTLGQVALIPEDSKYDRYVVSQSQMKLTVNSEIADPYFVYSYFRTKEAKTLIERNAIVGGVPHINLGILKEFKLKLPPLCVQKRVANISRILDNKITLNRQINQTLEQMAQTLFKSWFVDFDPVIDNALDAGNPIPDDLQHRAEARKAVRESKGFKPLPDDVRQLFPDAFEESELGWVPKGWDVEALDSIADFQNGLALQKFRPESEDDDFLPVLKIAQLRQGYCEGKEKSRTDIKESCRVYNGDMIFSWSGTLMIDLWTGGNAALNQHLYKVTSKKFPQSFYLHWTKHHLARFQHIAAAKAVTMGHIKKGDLSDSKCLVPSSELIDAFDEYVGKYLKQSINVRLQCYTLVALRDTLLPKLISGELRLDDVEVAVEQETVSA